MINNVETLASVPKIIEMGGKWYNQYGLEKAPGTKVFALAGDIINTGIIEVPIGMPLGEIIYRIGGGIPDRKQFKAAQIGGPSGGCVTQDNLNVQSDYESLAMLGAIMGSGGLIVMNEDTCMVDTARYFMEFIRMKAAACVRLSYWNQKNAGNSELITWVKARKDIELLEELAML